MMEHLGGVGPEQLVVGNQEKRVQRCWPDK